MADGWGDDDDFSIDDESSDDGAAGKEQAGSPIAQHLNSSESNPGVSDGWNDDDLDLDVDDDEDDEDDDSETAVPPPPAKKEMSRKEQEILSSLISYVQTMPHMTPSLNAVLEAEYNTYDHAMHLCEYYDKRPQLQKYTIETELPRMDYRVIFDDGTVLEDKAEIAQHLASPSDASPILARCANQSLLADILTVITGPDLLIRSQHLATGIASSCKFTLYSSHVSCDCRINLSIPGQSGQRLDVATLDIAVFLEPEMPSVQYQLRQVIPLIDPKKDVAQLQQSAVFLASMELDDDIFLEQQAPSNTDAFRDSFLVQLSKTHELVQASSSGLSSAWRQIDTVANVSSKIDFMKKMGGGIMQSFPTDMYEEEQDAPIAPEKVVTASDRPAPLLGGFLMSGLSRLAKSVAIPDEEPPPEVQESRFPKLYRGDPPPQPPSLPPRAPPPPPPPRAPPPPPVTTMTTTMVDSLIPNHAGDSSSQDDAESGSGWDDDAVDELEFDDEIVFQDTGPTDKTQGQESPTGISTRPARPGHTTNTQVSPEEKNVVVQLPPPPPPPPQLLPQPPPPASVRRPPPPPPTQTPVAVTQPQPTSLLEVGPLTKYNPDDDIIPTRVRWVNRRLQASN